MYRGYKNRNARLDKLDQTPPQFLSASKVALANQDFREIDSEEVLQEVYDYLALKNALLERVIRARKTHHTHFFSENLDYGHQHYLDSLSSQKFIVIRALERLERRTADVLYEKRKWFKWVRECQDTEEAQRDNEKKKVKQEAALFKRHEKEVKLHMQELRAKEDSQRQDAELEKAYYERMGDSEKEKVEEDWDPIEDLVEHERGTYIDLIRHFLFLPHVASDGPSASTTKSNGEDKPGHQPAADSDNTPEAATISAKSKKKTPKPQARKEIRDKPARDVPDKSAHESAADIRKRLREGMELAYASGIHMAGTLDAPAELKDKTAPIPDKEIDHLLDELAEIKLLLFCRLLLSHATLLPAALKATSVEEFLLDKDVTDTDLRDLCLKTENPGLQEIRDACADLSRGEEEADEEDDPTENQDDGEISKSDRKHERLGLSRKVRSNIPEKWSSEREKGLKKQDQVLQAGTDKFENLSQRTMIDFGDINDEGKFQSRKIRVRICGKHIYNYRSEKAVSRGGWLHFSILAKDSGLHKAIELCRNWDEFWELNILSIFQYFPAANWLVWKGDRRRQQLLQLGLIPYFEFGGAEEASFKHQTGSRGHQYRRAHAITEYRNFMCLHIKRNDAASRRFCQYLPLQSRRVVTLIRDVKTGQILYKPPEGPDGQYWLSRTKSGLGRASKNEYEVTSEVGPKFFETTDKHRDWHFSFKDYYDIYVWDLQPGKHFSWLYSTVHDTMLKALRCCDMKDMYKQAAPIMKTIHRDPDTFRPRDAKAGEETLWDLVQRSKSQFIDTETQTVAEDQLEYLFYSEADALEDYILFPDEHLESDTVYRPHANALQKLAGKAPNMLRFIHDLDTDEETDPSSDEDQLSDDDGDDECDHLIANDGEDFKAHFKAITDRSHSASSSEDDTPDSDESSQSEDEAESKYKDSDVFSLLKGANLEDKKDLAVLKGWNHPGLWERRLKGGDPQEEFMTFLDREKSKFFKESWHAADLTPNAQAMYTEAQQMIKQMEKHNFSTGPFKWTHDLRFLGIHPDTNRRVVPDMEQARAMMTLFFSSDFLDSNHGEAFKDSLLLKQEERANLGPPKIRSNCSTKFRSRSFWADWDDIRKKKDFELRKIPREWDNTIRPIIAKLYREGVIGEAHVPYPPGQAIAATEPDRDPDLYFDFRVLEKDITFPSSVEQNPPTKEKLILKAQSYAKDHPNARFALLRLWSAPHFYPLMLGLDRRGMISFSDIVGRAWEWKFIPKDMPCSELSIHNQSRMRLQPHQHLLGKNVLCSRDMFLVMGEDEADLLKFATATTFAIQTAPWRLEVDLWKSFVNVDLGCLEGLKEKWMG